MGTLEDVQNLVFNLLTNIFFCINISFLVHLDIFLPKSEAGLPTPLVILFCFNKMLIQKLQ